MDSHYSARLGNYKLHQTIFSTQASRLNLTVIRFTPEGHMKGISPASGSFLQLCPGSWTSLDKGLRFGAQYQFSCMMPAHQLLQVKDTEFLDLYLQYWERGESLLYAVPVLVLDLKVGGKSANKVQNGELKSLKLRLSPNHLPYLTLFPTF
jgi:hypothetical protein